MNPEPAPKQVHLLERNKWLWFEDGNVVVAAGHFSFRVYQGLLKARSSVFRRMAEMDIYTHPEALQRAGREFQDGLKVESLLRALFDSRYTMEDQCSFGGIVEACAILELSHQYDIVHLYRRAFEVLERHFPMRLPELQKAKVIYSSRSERVILPSILEAAFHTGAWWLLPSLYYLVCMPPTAKADWDERNERVLAIARAAAPLLLLEARSIQHAVVQMSYTTTTCRLQGACVNKHAARYRYNELSARLSIPQQCADPLAHPDDMQPVSQQLVMPAACSDKPSPSTNGLERYLCKPCCTRAKKRYLSQMSKSWESLPTIFGLPPWDRLQQLRKTLVKDGFMTSYLQK
ncbi:hypothetical protein C8J57DRAFT_1499160 [Mycena rebaudengoi]|nr:hypothetical protein C8J57DRAFT_1499160 [Mycena rebaudengoi]